MRLAAGSLRHRIELQQQTQTVNDFGDPVITWTTKHRRRASIEPLVGREYFEARALQEQDTVRVRCHYVSGIDSSWRVLDVEDGVAYDIQSVHDPERMRESLEMIATRITTDG